MDAEFGVSTPGLPNDLAGLKTLRRSLGVTPGIGMWYDQWSLDPNFPAAQATAIAKLGITPEITWEPWNPSDGVNQPQYDLASIIDGSHDAYIRNWARQIKAWHGTVKLRFAQEMNANWYPWCEGVNGNAPGAYRTAWQHVYNIFKSVGTRNVIWVWSPNTQFPGSTPFSASWPGDSYVSQVALDGYNWGSTRSDTRWQSFSQVFSPSVNALTALTQKPLYIGEVASAEDGGNKASWITNMFAVLKASPAIKGFVWFDHDKETDWRINSSTASLAAFRSGLADYRR